MLGWVSTISRTVSRPVAYLDRTLATGKSATARQSGSTPERGGPAARQASGDDEWQTADVGKSIPGWRAVVDCQAVPEWQSGHERQTVPEWKTDMWKRRVEGEAKKHFDGEIAGVGRYRS